METVIGIVGESLFHRVGVKFNNGLVNFEKIATGEYPEYINLVEVVIAPESDSQAYYFVDQFSEKFAGKMLELFGIADVSNLLIEFSQEDEIE